MNDGVMTPTPHVQSLDFGQLNLPSSLGSFCSRWLHGLGELL